MFNETGGLVCFTGGGGKTTSMQRLTDRLTQNGRFGHATVLVTATTKMAIDEPWSSASVVGQNILLAKNYPSVFSPDLISRIKNITEAHRIVFLFQDIDTENGKYIGLSPDEVFLLHGLNLASWTLVEADGAARKPLKGYAEHEPPLPRCFDWQIVLVGADALAQPMNEDTTARFEILRNFLGIKKGEVLTPPLLLRLLSSPIMYLKNSPPDVKRVLCINKSDILPPATLEPWITYLRAHLSHYHKILVTGRNEENFYGLDIAN